MKSATFVFYAAASFTLGAITYLLASPYAALSRLSDATGGLAGLISVGALFVMFACPLLFIIEGALDTYRDGRPAVAAEPGPASPAARPIAIAVCIGVVLLAGWAILGMQR